MATISVSDVNFQQADAYLAAFLSENIPEGDFSVGSALRDLAVKSIALIYALVEQERQTAAANGSLLLLSQATPSPDVDAAVDAYLSNLFVTRKSGLSSRVVVTLHFSASTDVVLTNTVRFYRTATLVYVPDITGSVAIPAANLTYNTYPNGKTDYTCPVTLVAVNVGPVYDAAPGRFLQADTFNPYFLFAENLSNGSGGLAPETTTALLARAPTALSTRNLINNRSVNAVLLDMFANLQRVLAVGMGEAEMQRDVASVGSAALHLGGCVDLYLALPRTQVTEVLTAGASFARPDGRVSLFRDSTSLTVFSQVRVGQVLNVLSGFPDSPRQYKIIRVTPSELEVDLPFLSAIDPVDYTIGSLSPNFSDTVSLQTTGLTSATSSTPNTVVLQGLPVYRISAVSQDDGTGNMVALPLRRNRGVPPPAGQFAVTVRNPLQGQSALSVTEVCVPNDGLSVSITYDTLVDYATVQSYINGAFDRIINASQLARGYNPIYVRLSIAYKPITGSLGVYAQADLSTAVATYISNYGNLDTLSVAEIVSALKSAFPNIGTVFPPTVNYDLYAPDGQVINFSSGDVLTTDPAKSSSAASCLNVLANGDLADYLASLGITDRTVRYFADPSDIYVYSLGADAAPVATAPTYPYVDATPAAPGATSSLLPVR